MKRFVVIPAYNEEKSIQFVIKKIKDHIANIIVVDDNSCDKTAILAAEAGADVLHLNANLGYDAALEKGIQYALKKGAKAILTMDADGQHPVSLINEMLDYIENENYQIVIGVRANLPRFSERVFAIYGGLFFGLKDVTCGMKCYSSKLIMKYGFGSKHKSIGTYLTIKALKMKERHKKIKVDVKKRQDDSRFGSNISSECSILIALIKSIFY